MDLPVLRSATPDDAASLLAIYAPYIRDTAVTYEYDIPSEEEFRKRIEKTLLHFPYIVAEYDGTICGYAYANPLHERKAFMFSTEISIYIAKDFHGRHIGKALYEELESQIKARGFKAVYALIAATRRSPDAHLTDASIKFHTKMGFSQVGYLTACGYKFEKWYDLVYMEKHIAPIEESPSF